jgi:hypothetical protein
METQAQRPNPQSGPQPAPKKGAPATNAAHAVRRDVSVRVSVPAAQIDADELGEEGYGHGV